MELDKILHYISQTYHPVSIILYGSYADGTNCESSDFDALVISRDHDVWHDTSFVSGIQLDVFIYPESFFEGDYNCEDFVQIKDGQIIVDVNHSGELLKKRVLSYVESLPRKSKQEIQCDIDWCEKMLVRAKRPDVEGMYRRHWLLIDSLEIFCNAVNHLYTGPKKSLLWMEKNYPMEFACYKRALSDFNDESLASWIACLKCITLSNKC